VRREELKESSFILHFEYGTRVGKQEYWTYDHMSLQFEDCIDCVWALYPNYSSVWMFEHSCGHDRGREDGLLVKNMQVTWAGKQKKTTNINCPRTRVSWTAITKTAGWRCPTDDFFRSWWRSILFETNGPWAHRYDEVIGEKVQKRLKEDLKKELEALGINTRGKVISELHDICEERNIPLTTIEKIYKKDRWANHNA
jgi:hypothetical protein